MNEYKSLYRTKNSASPQSGSGVPRKIDWDNLINELTAIQAKEIIKDANKKLIRKFKNKLNGKCK